MAENIAQKSQYEYKANSNLVLRANRRELPKEETTGEPESLHGRIDPKEFGSKALRAVPEEQLKKAKKLKEEAMSGIGKSKQGAAKRLLATMSGDANILVSSEAIEGLRYRPRTKENRQNYELLLTFVQPFLSEQPRDVLRGAVDEVLAILKNDEIKDFDRKKEVESVIGGLDADSFSQLMNLGKLITDYFDSSSLNNNGGNMNDIENSAAAVDEVGVAIVFDDEEEQEEDFEIKDVADEDEFEDGAAGLEEGDSDMLENASNKQIQDEVYGDSEDKAKDESTFEKQVSKYYVSVHDIDAYWLQRQISQYFSDAMSSQEMTEKVFTVLEEAKDDRECENDLVSLLEYDKFELIKLLTKNRLAVYLCTLLNRAASEEEKAVIVKRHASVPGVSDIISRLGMSREEESTRFDRKQRVRREAVSMDVDVDESVEKASTTAISGPKVIDLESLVFTQGNHLMTNKKCRLPENSVKKTRKGYEEIHIPAPPGKPFGSKERLVPIAELPDWAQAAFKGASSLNRIQSRLYKTALGSDENVLLCAPTGAGKTNVAMLTILRELNKNMDPESGLIDLDAFKIIYVAPMKALVAEMVETFSKRLRPYGVTVAELTGDRQLTKSQIADTQIIFTTPEKWDVITRKQTDRSYTKLVRLIIIDEIHLLHDERGPVLESIISRTIRTVEQTQEPVRLVGLSATLPNYEDVAHFLQVDKKSGLFFFDSSYRPVPLSQQFVGITEKKALKRLQLMNDITYEKVMERAGKKQMLIFVHSRRDTAKTARMIRDTAIEKEAIGLFVKESNQGSREILQAQSESTKNVDLKDLLPYGFAIHNAGMTRADRTLVEDLFREGHIQVLVSTATLSWGCNLPSSTVIIKGTQVYNPEKGRWVELTSQDMLQMLGRAGRPQYDTSGEGIIITSHQELQYYLSLLNQQLPIESQFISRMVDNLNAEIVLGSIRSRDDAISWLGYTYLFVRMLKDPATYGILESELASDPTLKKRRSDLIHSAALILEKCGLLKYERKSGLFQGTELGKIASYYYITHSSMLTYNNNLKPHMSEIEIFRIFSMSNEFKYIPVREEEKLELQKLMERVPIPVKEMVDEPTAKINVLLQSYISQLKLEGFALISDMVYVTQSALRIMRAIFELSLRKGWARLARKTLDLCKMIDQRIWLSMSPLRQFKGSVSISMDLLRKMERKDFPWSRYFDLNSQELGELVRAPKMGKTLHKLIHQFPRINIQAHVQPITRSMLKIDLSLTPNFEYDPKCHGASEMFWVMVEDADGENVLYVDNLIVKAKYAGEEHLMTFTVPLFEPLAPNYFITVISDRWLQSETRLPISFSNLILPEKYPPSTEVLDLIPLSVTAFKDAAIERNYLQEFKTFNSIQTQTFSSLYGSDDNVFIGSPSGSGKSLCAEIAAIRMWKKKKDGKVVYIVPFQDLTDHVVSRWSHVFEHVLGGKTVNKLTGEMTVDLKLLEVSDAIVSTPDNWDAISRRWKQRKTIGLIELFIADELHLIGGEGGPTYEVIVSRMRYIAVQQDRHIRIVALSSSVANGRDMGEWIGAIPGTSIFNFHPNARPVPLEVHIQSFNISHFASMMLTMGKPAYLAIKKYSSAEKPTLIFSPSRKQARLTAAEIIAFAAADGQPSQFLNCTANELAPFQSKIQDANLAEMLGSGVAYYHENMSKSDQEIVKQLFEVGAVQVLVASRETCWSLESVHCHFVIIMGCQYYEGKEHRYVDYSMPSILQMIGRASRVEDSVSRCLVMCHQTKKDFYKKFLNEPLPLESHLDHFLHDHFNAEIVSRTIENTQDAIDFLTWTFLYRRMSLNPNYYGLQGATNDHLSEHLSELVETTLNDLVSSKCISISDDYEVSPLNLGMIAAYYRINYLTMEMMGMSLNSTTKLKGLLEILCASSEFDNIPMRHGEELILNRIYDRVPVKAQKPNMHAPSLKANILVQSHFSRTALPADLESDQREILLKILPLLQACVDVISSNGWLNPAISAMEMSQMIVQGMWDRDSPLKQLPYFDSERIEIAKNKEVENVFDLMELEDEDRNEILSGLRSSQVQKVAEAVNRYPNIEITYQFEETEEAYNTNDIVTLFVTLEREDMDEEEAVSSVIAPFYPKPKDEAWWVVLGDPSEKTLLSIKRVTLAVNSRLKLDFKPPRAGNLKLKLYAMCDSYVGCDQEYDIPVTIEQGEEIMEEDEEEEEEQVPDENEEGEEDTEMQES